MKKKAKKLVLAKETVRNLEQMALRGAAGADIYSYCSACSGTTYPPVTVVACGSGVTTCGPYACEFACIEG